MMIPLQANSPLEHMSEPAASVADPVTRSITNPCTITFWVQFAIA